MSRCCLVQAPCRLAMGLSGSLYWEQAKENAERYPQTHMVSRVLQRSLLSLIDLGLPFYLYPLLAYAPSITAGYCRRLKVIFPTSCTGKKLSRSQAAIFNPHVRAYKVSSTAGEDAFSEYGITPNTGSLSRQITHQSTDHS